jgi:hypothetical protein
MEYVDADQLDLEDEDAKKEDRPDPTGVGAALRLHWQETVREETEKRIKEVSLGPLFSPMLCFACSESSCLILDAFLILSYLASCLNWTSIYACM